MKFFTILTLFFSIISNDLFSAEKCIQTVTESPPFYVSDRYKQGDKVWENLRDLSNEHRVKYYLPTGSIVYVPEQLIKNTKSSKIRVPVEVLSIANDKLLRNLATARYYDRKDRKWHKKSNFRRKSSRFNKYKKPKVGAQGYISKESLIRVEKYKFKIKTSSPLYRTPNATNLNEHFLSLKMQNDKYQIICCSKLPYRNKSELIKSCSSSKSKGNRYHYLFNVLDKDGDPIIKNGRSESIPVDIQCTPFAKDLLPIPNKSFDFIANILKITEIDQDAPHNMTYMDYAGIEHLNMLISKRNKNEDETKVDLIQFPFDQKTGLGLFNSYHYNPDDKGHSDVFLKPHSACALMQVMKEFDSYCKNKLGCQIQLGDMQHDRKYGVHKAHESGECIDIRPFRRKDDSQRRGLNINHGRGIKRYSRERTEKFIELAIKAGATSILFNDRVINRRYEKYSHRKKVRPDLNPKRWYKRISSKKKKVTRLPKWSPGHDNHIHLCFSKGQYSNEINNTCKNGIE